MLTLTITVMMLNPMKTDALMQNPPGLRGSLESSWALAPTPRGKHGFASKQASGSASRVSSEALLKAVIPPGTILQRSGCKHQSKVQEKRAQRKTVDLFTGGLAPSSAVQYERIVVRFERFLGKMVAGLSVQSLLAQGAGQALTLWAVLFLQAGYDSETMGLGEANTFIAALKRILQAALFCPAAVYIPADSVLTAVRAAAKRWSEAEPYDFRLPMPEEVAEAMAGAGAYHGQLRMSLFVCLGFHLWTRPGEMLASSWSDLSPFYDRGLTCGVFRVRKPKTKKPPIQYVILESAWLRDLYLLLQAAYQQGDEKIFNWSAYDLSKRWHFLLQKLDLHHEFDLGIPGTKDLVRKFTPASLRSGGATADFMRHLNADRIQWRGRWAVPGTLRHYLQIGVFHAGALEFSVKARKKIEFYRTFWHQFLSELPLAG